MPIVLAFRQRSSLNYIVWPKHDLGKTSTWRYSDKAAGPGKWRNEINRNGNLKIIKV